jgi:hypothetical protein
MLVERKGNSEKDKRNTVEKSIGEISDGFF